MIQENKLFEETTTGLTSAIEFLQRIGRWTDAHQTKSLREVIQEANSVKRNQVILTEG